MTSWGDLNVIALCDLGHSTKVGEQMILHVRAERCHHVCRMDDDGCRCCPMLRVSENNRNTLKLTTLESPKPRKLFSVPFMTWKLSMFCRRRLQDPGSSLGQKVLASSPPFVPHQRPLYTLACITFISTIRRKTDVSDWNRCNFQAFDQNMLEIWRSLACITSLWQHEAYTCWLVN